jgi:hypothetical protein
VAAGQSAGPTLQVDAGRALAPSTRRVRRGSRAQGHSGTGPVELLGRALELVGDPVLGLCSPAGKGVPLDQTPEGEGLLHGGAEKTCRLSSAALAGSELVACRRAADNTTDQPAPAQSEGREHVRAAIASHVGGRCHPVARCTLGESPDPHDRRSYAVWLVTFDRALNRGCSRRSRVWSRKPGAVGPRRVAP